MAELTDQVAQERRARRGRARTSPGVWRHLPGNEQVDLATVVFIEGEALVNLRFRDIREAVFPQRINRFAVLHQANDIVDCDSGPFNNGVPAPDVYRAHDMAIGFRGRTHTWMVRHASTGVNDEGSQCW